MDPRDRPDISEIEITPEMEEAGAEVLRVWSCGDLPELAAGRVFRAMVRVRDAGMGKVKVPVRAEQDQ